MECAKCGESEDELFIFELCPLDLTEIPICYSCAHSPSTEDTPEGPTPAPTNTNQEISSDDKSELESDDDVILERELIKMKKIDPAVFKRRRGHKGIIRYTKKGYLSSLAARYQTKTEVGSKKEYEPDPDFLELFNVKHWLNLQAYVYLDDSHAHVSSDAFETIYDVLKNQLLKTMILDIAAIHSKAPRKLSNRHSPQVKRETVIAYLNEKAKSEGSMLHRLTLKNSSIAHTKEQIIRQMDRETQVTEPSEINHLWRRRRARAFKQLLKELEVKKKKESKKKGENPPEMARDAADVAESMETDDPADTDTETVEMRGTVEN